MFKRTITGVFLVVFVMGGLWFHPVSFILVGALLLAGSLNEYYHLISLGGTSVSKSAGIIISLSIYCISVLVASETIDAAWYLIVMPEILVLMIAGIFGREEKPFDSIAHTIFGVFFISLPYSLLPFLSFGFYGLRTVIQGGPDNFSPGLILGFLALSWSFDTAAYLFGSWLGKHKLMERISPEKSWEGFITGMLVALIIAWPVSELIGMISLKDWIILAVIISVTGTLGDLLESMLKRSVGVKDSGSILPGHGGLLDRFDSMILSIPFVFLYIFLFG